MGNKSFIFLPGDVTIDAVNAIKVALTKFKPTKLRHNSAHAIQQIRRSINSAAPTVLRTRIPISPKKWRPRNYLRPMLYETKENKMERIRRELLDAGMTFYGLLKSETKVLHKLLHPNEHIEAVVYGHHHSSLVMLVATNERILFVDKKIMALYLDEVSYEVISGIEFEIHLLFATIVLHTPVKNYDIHYANLHCAENFARHIEAHRLQREDNESQEAAVAAQIEDEIKRRLEPTDDLAGYYWLPLDEEEERPRPVPETS